MKNATLELDENEILEAIKAHVEKDGWKVAGKVSLTYHPGSTDQREPGSSFVTASVKVGR